uniref:Uncharacterized protein n=1 Tax=Arundo donax TaxID=35708 RepID=A0A0A8XQ53_ARUDO
MHAVTIQNAVFIVSRVVVKCMNMYKLRARHIYVPVKPKSSAHIRAYVTRGSTAHTCARVQYVP